MVVFFMLELEARAMFLLLRAAKAGLVTCASLDERRSSLPA